MAHTGQVWAPDMPTSFPRCIAKPPPGTGGLRGGVAVVRGREPVSCRGCAGTAAGRRVALPHRRTGRGSDWVRRLVGGATGSSTDGSERLCAAVVLVGDRQHRLPG